MTIKIKVVYIYGIILRLKNTISLPTGWGGQSENLGAIKGGRLTRYYRKSYLNSKVLGESLIVKSLLKYGHENFSLIILEYCSIELLDEREQQWIDLLKPQYNILKFVKSSRGYKHTKSSLKKMKGPRPYYKLSSEHLDKLKLLSKNRVYTKSFKDAISQRFGLTVYVYDNFGKLLNIYPSIIKFKEAYGIKLHHKTLYKHISEGTLVNGFRLSLSPLSSIDKQSSSIVSINNKNKLKPRKIQLTNTVKPELSKTFESLSSAAFYIKQVDGSCDRGTLRKYINSDKLYHKTWKINDL